MAESKWGFPKDVHPLTPWRNRPAANVRHWAPYLPEVHIVLGADDVSAGVTISAWTPTLGAFAAVETLYAKRWVLKCQSVQEALDVARRALAEALAELFDAPPE